jgi:hypothetical protein
MGIRMGMTAIGGSTARTLNRLSAREVTSLKAPNRYADGGGLYLRITDAGARCWAFMTTRGGKREEIGLGSATGVSLAAARQIGVGVKLMIGNI